MYDTAKNLLDTKRVECTRRGTHVRCRSSGTSRMLGRILSAVGKIGRYGEGVRKGCVLFEKMVSGGWKTLVQKGTRR